MQVRRTSRRSFLSFVALSSSAALLAACGQQAAAPPAAPAATAAPAAPGATTAPAAAAKPAESKPAAAAPAATTAPAAAGATTAPAAAAKPAAGGTPKRGGNLVMGHQNPTQTFDPHRSTGTPPSAGLLYNTLVRWVVQADGSMKAEPELATEWKLDGNTATFTLRKDVKFHDGTDWNAEVAKFNLERMNDGKSQARAFVSGIKSVEAVDPYTIKLNLSGPQGSLLSNLSQAADARPYMISKTMAEKAGDNYGTSPETTAGTGSMKLTEWVSGSHSVYTKTGTYFDKGADGQPLPYFESFRARFIADDSVRLTELRSGNVHLIDNVQAKDVPVARQDAAIDVVENKYQKNQYQFTFSAKSEKFGKEQLRKAVQYAIDREAAAKVLGQGVGEAQYWFLTPGYLGFDDKLPKYSFDPAKAKALVAEAGYASGVDIGMVIINRPVDQQLAQMVKQMLGDVGIRAEIEVLERLAFLAKTQTLEYDMNLYQTSVRPDPDSILAGRFQTGEGKNTGGMSDPTMDDLLNKGRSSLDDKVRAQIYGDVQKRIYDTGWYGTIWMKQWFDARTKKLTGIPSTQEPGFDLRAAWLDA